MARPEPWRGPNEGGPERGHRCTTLKQPSPTSPRHTTTSTERGHRCTTLKQPSPTSPRTRTRPTEQGQDRTTLKQPSPTSPKAPTRPAELGHRGTQRARGATVEKQESHSEEWL